jgi:hypothetical protein
MSRLTSCITNSGITGGAQLTVGAEMNRADYSQWHGIYELNTAMAELKTIAREKETQK